MSVVQPNNDSFIMKKIFKGLYLVDDIEYVMDNSFSYPFRTDNSAILLVLKGELKIQVDLISYSVRKNDMIIIPSGSICRTSEITEPTRLLGLVFTDEFANSNIQNIQDINTVRFFFIKKSPQISLLEENYKAFQLLLKQLEPLTYSVTNYKKDKIFHYFNLIIIEIMDFYRSGEHSELESKTIRKKEIVQNLIQLVHKHASVERHVEFYADKLSVTPGYLTKVLKEVSGLTTREIIEESVIMEARDLLLNTNLTIAEIAYQLHFSDQSFFGKFFKNKMKKSPKNFRADIHK